MNSKMVFVISLSLALVMASVNTLAGQSAVSNEAAYEVWVVDQSDTRTDGGGTLYIYQGDTLTGQDAASAAPETIDLGGAACA